MEHDPLDIAILVLQITIVGWLLAHSLQCAKRDGRVSRLEEWKQEQDEKRRLS